MNIMTNLTVLTASRHLGVNTTNLKKSIEKLSSGYKINRAADGAAELGISEQMRSQIRGLNRSVTNAEEGANFIQTGDGAMNEIHAMLQRMRELFVQSLNDTNTHADRAALAAEFDELQSEIDRISKGTYFNTQPVFQEHEASYYQIAGNQRWAANQQHSISSPNNSLTIRLPDDLYAPPEDVYTIEVPDGVYTTQELIDEIEDAFMAMDTPSKNPGFVLEFTDEGYCNLNFENADGEPVKIDSVDGPLSYLIYDSYSGNSSANLLGTTIFSTGDIEVKANTNDQLSFLMEALDGSSKRVELTITPGFYNRQDMIDELNDQLKKEGLTDQGVIASEYGSSSIQITGGPTISITGLKGNMFTIETDNDVYTGVFYDNICPGAAVDTPAQFYGKAYFNANYTSNIKIDTTNNKLTFKLGSDPFEITFNSSQQKEYTIHEMAEELNDMFSHSSCPVKAEVKSIYIPSGNDYTAGTYYYLVFTGTEAEDNLTFNFDTSDPVCEKTYETLFCNTNYDYSTPPTTFEGSDPSSESPALLTGRPSLPSSISLPNAKNEVGIIINGTNYTLTDIPQGPHTQSELAKILNDKLNASLPANLKGKVDIQFSGNKLIIKGTTLDITGISVDQNSEAGRQLFATSLPNMACQIRNGHEIYTNNQGSGGSTKDFVPASITMNQAIPNNNTKIESPNNELSFSLNGHTVTLTLTPREYDRTSLIAEINKQIQNHPLKPNVEASLTGNCFTLKTKENGYNSDHRLSVSTSAGTAWDAIVGTTITYPKDGAISPATSGTSAGLISTHQFTSITIDNNNNEFAFIYSGKTYTITLDNDTYTPPDTLASHLQTKINSDPSIQEPDAVTVTYSPNNSSNGLVFTANHPGNKPYTLVQNGFYNTVLKNPIVKEVSGKPNGIESKHNYIDSYIIGREDLVHNNVTFEEELNDIFTIDLNYNPVSPSTDPAYTESLTVQFLPGEMTGNEIAAYLQEKLNEQLKNKGLAAEVQIGADNSIPVDGSNDDTALQIKIKELNENGITVNAPSGSYILDGVRGSAAYFIFYRTTHKPEATYITGTHNISDGIVFQPGKNELTFKLDDVPYSYEFPVGTKYTAQEFIDLLNDDFENGTINGKPVPLRASLQNGNLKLTYQSYGPHTITEVSGSAKGTVFFYEEDREYQDPYMLQVGALGHQGLELTRLRVNTASLGINSVTISRPKYAEKALNRLDHAIDLLSSRRSLYGALQNRIKFLTSANQNTSQNLQASESKIRDANMATEMMEFAKSRIMSQASEAVLAQANQLPSTVLVMLQ